MLFSPIFLLLLVLSAVAAAPSPRFRAQIPSIFRRPIAVSEPSPAPARAFWGPSGHAATAYIAQTLLSPEAQSALLALLPETSGELEPIASWADQIRSIPGWEWSFWLHFIDLPDNTQQYNLTRDCRNPDFPGYFCVDGAIQNYTNQLIGLQSGQGHMPTTEQINAIKFLTHFVGDIHQPLHVSRGIDQGGNLINGTFYGVATELHAIWDDLMINRRVELSFNNSYDQWKSFLVSQVAAMPYGIIHSWMECTKSGTAHYGACSQDWAQESASYAFSNAYVDTDGHPLPNNFAVGEAYYERNILLIEQRIMQGGVRLANLLNRLFAAY